MRRSFSSFFCGLAAMAIFASMGCRSDASDVRSVARAFIEASGREDAAAVRQVVTRGARPYFQEHTATPKRETGNVGGFKVEEPTIQGETAVVPVRWTDETGAEVRSLRLRREEGEWRVYALELPSFPGGPTMTMDFENPMAILPQAMRTAGVVMGQAARGMEQGAKEFARGFEEGYGKNAPTPPVVFPDGPPPPPPVTFPDPPAPTP
ncbi:MAG: hypothetical protein SFU56_09685 [Capsulimonadales bacterium]|nr:hypothetical protein [Capsulimonadales bacterium]